MNYTTAFKSYDIRGIWGQDIDARFGYIFGIGFGAYMIQTWGTDASVMIAADTRDANKDIMQAFLAGITQAGITHIINAGQPVPNDPRYPYGICSTTMAYAIHYQQHDCCVIFSASHNPAQYIGLKIVDRDNLFVDTTTLHEIFTQAEKKHIGHIYTAPETHDTSIYKAISPKSIKKFMDTMTAKFAHVQKRYSFTVDFGHGAGVTYEKDFFTHLREKGWDIHFLFDTPDGQFPAHATDTSRHDNYAQLLEYIQVNEHDFGIMFDGDADRIGMILPDGTIIPGDIITAIIAKILLTDGTVNKLGSREIMSDVFSSQTVREVVERHGGIYTMIRVGRGAFCRQFVESGALIAGEQSTHILWREYGNCEVSLLVLSTLLCEADNYASFTAMAQAYMTTIKSQVYHFGLKDKDGLLAYIQSHYEKEKLKILTIDGVRIQGDGRRYCLRKSGTEDIVKLCMEAKDQALFDEKLAEIRALIVGYGGHEE